MHEYHTLWDTKAFRFTREEAAIVPAFRDWLSHSESRLGQYLAGIQYASDFADFSKDDVHELEAMIVKAIGKKAAALSPLRLLGKVVYRVNHTLQLSIPQPTLAIHLTPPQNPLAFSDGVLAHRSVEAWLRAEKSWLDDLHGVPSTTRRRNVPFELLLLSGALHCGVLNEDLVIALHNAMLEPDMHLRYSNRVYVDLSVAWQGKPDQEIRRWYPDDGVACLIARLAPLASNSTMQTDPVYADWPRSFCGHMHRRLRDELRRQSVEEALLPKSLVDLFDRIALFLRTEMPAVMVRFATRELPARSLLRPSIDQVYGDPVAEAITVNDSDEAEPVKEEDADAYGGDDPGDAEPVWMLRIRESFGGETAKGLQENFGTLESASIVGRRVISFARSLIERGTSSGKKLKPNSVRCCVLTVGRRLGRLLEERDPAQIDSEILEDLYVRAIDDAAKDSQQPYHLQGTVAWALREFHCFLIRERLAKPLNESDVFRIPRGFPSVDAMIVSVDDVYNALHYLDYEPNPSWPDENREIAKIEILLGFFAGLRTMEGLGALHRHFPGGSLLPFLVLPTEDRDLKTPNAARMIPVAVNMEPFYDLTEYASRWANTAHKDSKDSNRGLFEKVSDDVIIPMVGAALRAVTGNERLRYYSLRHSFASWALTRLLLSDLPEVPDLFPHLPRTREWLHHSKQFRCALYGNDRVSNNHAWAVATLMGHSTPNVSFASYCHTFDIVLPEFLRNCSGLEFATNARERLRLSSFHSRSTAYDHLPGKQEIFGNSAPGAEVEPTSITDSGNQDEVFDQNADGQKKSNGALCSERGREENRIFALQEVKARFPNLQSEPVLTPRVVNRSWLEQTWGLLYMSAQPNRDLGELADFLGVEIEQARRILARNDEICCLRSPTTGDELHASIGVTLETAGGVQTVRYPRRPDSKAMIIAEQIGKQITQQIDKDCDNTTRILDYWSRNVVPQSASAVFTIRTQPDGESFPAPEIKNRVKEFRRFLSGLGMTQAKLRFEGACGMSTKFAPTSRYSQWGLIPRATCKIRNLSGTRAARVATGEWLAIGPRRACPGEKESFDSSYRDDFRFVMLLASIRFGATPCHR